jgi:hypothetical protein
MLTETLIAAAATPAMPATNSRPDMTLLVLASLFIIWQESPWRREEL